MSFEHPFRRPDQEVPSAALPAGYTHRVVAVTETTMKDVKTLLESGDPEAQHGFALQALHQTSGVGSQNRKWESGNGNLLFSMIVDMKDMHHREIALIMAVSLMHALPMVVPLNQGAVTFKMANDAFLGGGKLSGILASPVWNHENFCNLGVGVNLAVPPELPPGNPYRATCLREFGWAVERLPQEFLVPLLGVFDMVYQGTLQNRALPWIMLNAAYIKVGGLSVKMPQDENPVCTGLYKGFETDENGKDWLVLDTDLGQRRFDAAAVQVRLQNGGWTDPSPHI